MANEPWWAIALLDLDENSKEFKTRRAAQAGRLERVLKNDEAASMWESILHQANILAEKRPIDDWRIKADKQPDGKVAAAVRDACLFSERAFAQFAELKDDEGEPIVLADFHVQVVRAMRQHDPAAIFIPLEHGKSFLASIFVPLMDWAEWNNASSGRLYWNDKHVRKWTLKLMDQVEFNRELQMIFPWIRKPEAGDRSTQWGNDGFSIGGRTLPDRSFEPLTARGYSVGNRYSRVGADDWVNRGNASSLVEQDKLFDYFFEGAMTMAQKLRRVSKYGTKWASTFYVGTFYDRRDCGYRLFHRFLDSGDKALRLDVYQMDRTDTKINREKVLWPDGRDAKYIEKKRLNMPQRNFNARYRNMVVDEGMETFSIEDVNHACDVSLNAGEEYRFGKVPDKSYSMIGFDPAAGTRTRYSADPAISVYSEVPDLDDEGMETGAFTAHFVEWERLPGYDFTRQCQVVVNWAQRLLLPVVIEKNTLQGAYKEYIKKLAPDVKVYDHQTGAEKWDPEDGVETFAPLFANSRAVIHAQDAPYSELNALKVQLIEWPQSTKKDVLMSFWFARSKLRKRQKIRRLPRVVPDLPDYLDGLDYYWNTA